MTKVKLNFPLKIPLQYVCFLSFLNFGFKSPLGFPGPFVPMLVQATSFITTPAMVDVSAGFTAAATSRFHRSTHLGAKHFSFAPVSVVRNRCTAITVSAIVFFRDSVFYLFIVMSRSSRDHWTPSIIAHTSRST